ncbi:MAG: glycosyltransferase family 4 protein [Armatimonadota bacterium]
MHIAVDALLVYGAFSGVQHAILHQLRGLLSLEHEHRFTIIALQDVPVEEHLGETARPYTVFRAPLRSGQKLQRAWWQQLGLPDALRQLNVDLLYSPGYLTSLRWRGPSVAFVHDTIALSHPQLCTLSNALNYRLLLPPAARHATLVATPSHASARDAAYFCRVPNERIRVAPLGVKMPPAITREEQAALLDRYGITRPFLLAVSTIEPKKNFDSLIRWFTAWKEQDIPHQLVIIGKWGWGCGPVHEALADSPYRDEIHLPGYVPQSELPPIMAAADLLLMPSRYEGFGLPALEAMAAGVPVAVSNEGSLPEVASGAGLILPLHDHRWEAEIPELLGQPERLAAMRRAGLAWAAAHSWERTAERLLEIFEEAAASTS